MTKLNGSYLLVKHNPTGRTGIVVRANLSGRTYWIQEESNRPGFVDSIDQFEKLGRKTVKNWELRHPGPR